ncbi:MAG: LUD domain-containing protein [Pseudomonadota bacterium]
MTQSARDQILMDTRSALGAAKLPRRSAEVVRAEADALLADTDAARPSLEALDVIDAFVARAAGPKVNATVTRVENIQSVPNAIAEYLRNDSDAGLEVCIAPNATLTGLGWRAAGLTVVSKADDGVFVAMAQWAVAETGSVVLHSARDTPILPNFLALIHLVVVPRSRIVAHLEDYASAARAAGDPAPRNACLMTGPSGTSDIEGAFVRGAHGPKDVHVIVFGD